MYRDNTYTVSISLNKKLDYSAPIIFRPYGIATQKTNPAVAKTTPTKAVPPSPLALSAAKGGVSKGSAEKKAPTVMASVIKPAPIVKKEIAKVEPEKPVPAPVETKKEEVKPEPAPIKKEVIKKEEPKEITPVAKALDVQQAVTPVIPENAYVSDNYREVEALRRHAQLQNEIIKCWKPPFGVSSTSACDISFSVSTTGAVQDIVIAKSSGALMYDISARQALYAMAMPKWTYGKQLIINFKQ